GFIYSESGFFTAYFSNSPLAQSLIDQGILDDSTAILTLPTKYDNSDKDIQVFPYDRLCIKELNAYASLMQLVPYSGSGFDRLKFQATEITHNIVDKNGVVYFYGKDFTLENGGIRWIPSGAAPGWNQVNNK